MTPRFLFLGSSPLGDGQDTRDGPVKEPPKLESSHCHCHRTVQQHHILALEECTHEHEES
jgi:hypothetical protein